MIHIVNIHSLLYILFIFFGLDFASEPTVRQARQICTIQPKKDGSDDSSTILAAFEKCGRGGRIVFLPETYNIARVMKTIDLKDCQIDIQGTLRWSKDTDYWLKHSIPLNYQNQTSAWFLGGDGLIVNGFERGTLDGNGQTWYELVKGESNYPRRPHALTIYKATNSVFQNLRFVQSQMWTVTVHSSHNVLLQDIYVNSTSHTRVPARNTDGADTMFSSHITFRRWDIDNGDDGIALKANSTDITIEDSIFRRGQGLALGSIGQYPGKYETIENVLVRNLTLVGTKYAGYVKTWTGVQKGYPPNGGGGGVGTIRNITWKDFTLRNTNEILHFSQCTSFSRQKGDCDTSKFRITDFEFSNIRGTAKTDFVANLQCSAAAPCENIRISNINVRSTVGKEGVQTGLKADRYGCKNVKKTEDFQCNGDVTKNGNGS